MSKGISAVGERPALDGKVAGPGTGTEWEPRAARVVGGVMRQAVDDAQAAGIVLLRCDSPEGRVALEWLRRTLGGAAVWLPDPRSAAEQGLDWDALAGAGLPEDERERVVARVIATAHNALIANPANRTALVLSRHAPPEPLWPLGDVAASRVATLLGEWSAPPAVRELAERIGGIEALDRLLDDLLDRRVAEDAALGHLSVQGRLAVLAALDAARFTRMHSGLVPKLGARTLGIDLFS